MTNDEFTFKLGQAISQNRDYLYTLVCYKHPTDYPNKFVVRAHRVAGKGGLQEATELFFTADTEKEMHEGIAQGHFVWMSRHPYDDPKIIGVYL